MHGAVAPTAFAATAAGFMGELQMPKGRMFTIGTKSMIVAANLFSMFTGAPLGMTIRALGAAPYMHMSWADIATDGGMRLL
jgi:hypothetical protein